MTHKFSDKTEQAIQTLKEELPVPMEDLEADANLGGKLGVQDVAIPYLYVLQSMSPQVNPDNSKYIPDAKPGMFYLTALERVFEGRETGLTLVPCHYERMFVEWKQREAGGGFVGWHDPDSEVAIKTRPNENGIMTLPNGNMLQETAYHYVLVNADGPEWWQAIMPLKRTGLKVSRKMNYELATTKIPGKDIVAPRFLYAWKLRSIKEQRDQFIWSNVSLKKEGMVREGIYKLGKEFAIMASKGTLKRSVVEEAVEAPTKDNGKPLGDDEVPF